MEASKGREEPRRTDQRLILRAACIIICASAAAFAQGAAVPASGKFLDPEKLTAPFETGQEAVEVIVNLAAPKAPGLSRWDSAAFRQKRRAEIRARQEQVLTSLPAAEFGLRHRFENQASFSAFVTPAGLQALANHPLVESIEPVITLQPHLAQGIPLMNASGVRATYNGQDIAIAICDTGIDYTHPMLGGGGFPNTKIIGGYDFGDNDADPMPNTQAHGTACAGIAAGALGSVGSYIGGVAYNAKLYALKITSGTSGSAYSSDMAAAWDWCITHQYDAPNNPILVISTSFGGSGYTASCNSAYTSMTTAANNAVAAGITLFVSSGNDGYCDSISWPACISSVISVGAVYDAAFGTYYPCISAQSCAPKTFSPAGCSTSYYATDVTAADVVTSYSNTASFLNVLAPSNRAYTLDIAGSSGYSSGDYDSDFGGTSAACPYAAGAAACIQSAAIQIFGSPLSPTEVRDLMTTTGDDITDNKVAITKPRVNLGNAIGSMQPSPPTAANVTATTTLNTPVPILLQATDDGVPAPAQLTCRILSLPNHGTLTDPQAGLIISVPYDLANFGAQVIYTPRISCAAGATFLYAADDGGTAPVGGQSNIASVGIGVTISQTVYSADMNANPNWTLEGQWQWGMPAGSGGANGNPDPTAGFNGPAVIGYNLQGDYASKMGATQWAATPAIDCSNLGSVTLSFYRWLNVDAFSSDQAWLQVSNDNASWTAVWQNISGVTDAAWTLQTFDLSAVADGQPTVYLRWGMGPTSPNKNYSGWNLDDVTVSGFVAAPPPPAGDFEPDCDVDIDDLLYLVSFWLHACGNCGTADLVQDGLINLGDMAVLAQNWLTMP